ncbi:hypothetical protein VTO73DRAFT_15051 [Trametes versicolor]
MVDGQRSRSHPRVVTGTGSDCWSCYDRDQPSLSDVLGVLDIAAPPSSPPLCPLFDSARLGTCFVPRLAIRRLGLTPRDGTVAHTRPQRTRPRGSRVRVPRASVGVTGPGVSWSAVVGYLSAVFLAYLPYLVPSVTLPLSLCVVHSFSVRLVTAIVPSHHIHPPARAHRLSLHILTRSPPHHARTHSHPVSIPYR